MLDIKEIACRMRFMGWQTSKPTGPGSYPVVYQENGMTLQIDSTENIIVDGNPTGLKLRQCRGRTVIYTPECVLSGEKYKEHTMPNARYSAAHDYPRPSRYTDPALVAKYNTAGRAQLELDVLALLKLRRLEEELGLAKARIEFLEYEFLPADVARVQFWDSDKNNTEIK